MNLVTTAVAVAVATAFATGCAGSSSGPQTVLNLTNRASVVAACANVQTASANHLAGDDESAAGALASAVTAFRKPPADAASTSVAASISSQLAAGNTAGALSTGSSWCSSHGIG